MYDDCNPLHSLQLWRTDNRVQLYTDFEAHLHQMICSNYRYLLIIFANKPFCIFNTQRSPLTSWIEKYTFLPGACLSGRDNKFKSHQLSPKNCFHLFYLK